MALDEQSIGQLVAEALDAFATATSTAALKEARLAHLGDRSPLALANREIGSLPGPERKDAGQRLVTFGATGLAVAATGLLFLGLLRRRF